MLVDWVLVLGTAGEETCALFYGFVDECLQLGEGDRRDHRTNVWGCGVKEDRAEVEILNSWCYNFDESVVCAGEGDDTLDADAVLTR